MAQARPLLVLSALLLAGLAADAAAQLASTVHVVTADNRTCPPLNNCTSLSGTAWSPPFYLDGTRHLATASFNPAGGFEGIYYDDPIGAGLNPLNLFQEVLWGPPATGVMPLGAAFNLLKVRDDRSCFYTHTSAAANIVANVTFLDHASINGDPGAFLLVTAEGQAPPTNVGVYYDSFRSQWGIFNEDVSAMATDRRFSVYVSVLGCDIGLGYRNPITCSAPTAEICGGTGTTVAAGDPRAKVLVTQRWSGVYNPHPVGVVYDPVAQAWKVFNEDQADMPLNARFNVAVVDVLLDDDFESGDPTGWSFTTP
jgi:hypothetical protein